MSNFTKFDYNASILRQDRSKRHKGARSAEIHKGLNLVSISDHIHHRLHRNLWIYLQIDRKSGQEVLRSQKRHLGISSIGTSRLIHGA